MILLTVIAVGLLTLSSISLRSTSQGDAEAQARANSRLALMLAIGQMQQLTGPDQRVTTLADQRPKSADGKETSAAEGNRYWTGVYRSWPASGTVRPPPEFLSWMVSGNPVDTANVNLPDSPTAAGAVELVGTGTLGTAATTGKIRVPVLKISQGGKQARLAWWVGDQGMKAAISTPVPSSNTSLGVIRTGLQGAPRNAVEFAAAGTVKPFAAINPVDPRLGRIASWQSAGLIASTPKAPQPLFHDLAPFSTGLLTNVAAGGFRKDLSMRLERQATGTGANAPPDPNGTALYTVGGEPGINLNELWLYYNAYKDIKRSGSYNFTTSGQLTSSTPHLLVESSPALCANDFEFFLKQPTIISYQMVLSLKAFPMTVGGATVNRLHLVADPVVTLWNPLDIPVVIPQTSFISVKYWQIPYSITVKVNGVATFDTVPLHATLSEARFNSNRNQNYMSIQLGTSLAEQIVLKPGEVVKFSQSGSVKMGFVGGVDAFSLIAKKGFNYDGGYALPLTNLAGTFIDLNPSDEVTYEAFANNITSGKTNSSGNSVSGTNQHTRHYSITHHEVFVGKDRDGLPNSLGYGNMAIDWDFGNKRLKAAESRGTAAPGILGTKPSGERLYANNFPNLFRPIASPNTRPLSTSALLTNKSPFMLLTYDAKTALGSDTLTRSLTRFNPKAHHVDFYELTPQEIDRMPYEFRVEPMVSWVNRSLDLSPDGSGFFGGGMNGASGTNQVTTHSLPREPLVSLAAFQHSFANGFVHPKPTPGLFSLNAREPMLPQISHAIGNSLAPAILAPDMTEGTLRGNRPVADHSYLANRALWDDYFLSGIAPQEAVTFGTERDQKTVATEFFTRDPVLFKPLPVVRYKPATDGEDPAMLISSFFSDTNPTDAGFLNLASYLRVEGLFNINSTSVEAWKAMLGSLKGRPIIVRDVTGRESIAPTGVPVTGLQNPQDLIAAGTGTLNIRNASQWVGRRELSGPEIGNLASALVAEIRKRGPFLSLADFVNRRVGLNEDLARAGALQSAIDNSAVGLNKAFGSVGGATAARFAFPEAEMGSTSYGIPGIIKQADLLTPIAPVLSARSDSFVIRAYGESVDATGKVTARAWCEALVERDRNFVDATNRPETATDSLSPTNDKFGRRYKIISFRWLSPSEV